MIEETSRLAYVQGREGFDSQCDMIYDYIVKHSPCTQHMVRSAFGMEASTVAGRFNDLENDKRIRKCGKTNELSAYGRLVLMYEPIEQANTFTLANADWEKEEYPFELEDLGGLDI